MQILQLDCTKIVSKSLGALGDIIRQQSSVHFSNSKVQSTLEVQIYILILNTGSCFALFGLLDWAHLW